MYPKFKLSYEWHSLGRKMTFNWSLNIQHKNSFLKRAKYIGSMFVVRALKINKEKTDERVTSINYHNKKIISIFSGKWNNCIYLAKYLNLKK